tara:strand:+ start:7655 stop:9259 length:1605 start_codon:yes stop_codon:yes gene_type:complete
MKNKKESKNQKDNFIGNFINFIKVFFNKISPKLENLSDKSISSVDTWKKKQSPTFMKYTEKILQQIKRIKDLLGPTFIKTFIFIRKVLINLREAIPVLGKIYKYISKHLNNLFSRTKHILRKTLHFFQVLFSPLVWLINFIWSLRILIAVGLIIFLVWSRFAQSPSINIVDDDIRLSTTQMSIGEISEFVKTSGKIVPKREEKLYSKIDLPLKKVYVKYGDLVEEGQLLLELDSDLIETDINTQKQKLTVISKKYDLALKKAESNKKLLEQGFISKDEYELSLRVPEQILIDKSNTELNLKKLDAQLLNTRFISPIKGRVDYIDPAITQENAQRGGIKVGIYKWFFTISSSNDELNLNLSIDGRDVSKVEIGQDVMFKVDSFKQRKFYGKIVKIIEPLNLKPHTNKAPVFYELIASINEKEIKLKSGLSVDAEIKIQTKTGIKRIPRSALRFVPPKDIVVKIPPPNNATTLIVWIANEDNSISAIPIKTGIKDNQYIEVPEDTKITLEDSIVIGATVPQTKKKGKFALPQPKRY